jgi:hypothetical protein
MIEKMKIMTSNNSKTNIKEKYSKKRYNNISNRIRSLEKDINKIKNKEGLHNRKILDNNISIIFDKNSNTIINDQTKNNPQSKNTINQKSFVKNSLFYNDNKPNKKYSTNNSSYSNKTNKYKKDYCKIYKKINKYNNAIHEKKNILLNMKSHFRKRANTKDSFNKFTKLSLSKNFEQTNNLYKNNYITGEKNLYNIKLQSGIQSSKKTRHLISMDKINSNNESSENVKNCIYTNNNMNDMANIEFEFELRHLKKKRNILKKTNEEMITKLEEIKNQNNIMKNNIVQEQKHNDNIMRNIILLNKNYSMNNKNNGLEYFDSVSNRSNSEELSFKHIILNIMDIKFEYEYNNLYNQLTEGLNELLNISIITNNSYYNDTILKELNDYINIQKTLNQSNDKYKYLIEENTKYLQYFSNLLKDLNLKNLDELRISIRNIFVKNIKEEERMKKIKHALIKETTLDKNQIKKEKENIKRKISNQYFNSVNQTFFNLKNDNDNDNDDDNDYYKFQEKYINKNKKINNKTMNNYDGNKKKVRNYIILQDSLNEKNEISNKKCTLDQSNFKNEFQTLLFDNDRKNKFISLNQSNKKYGEIDFSEINDKKNNLIRNSCYNGNNNYYNRYSKNNYMKNEDDYIYLNKNEESKNENNFDTFGLPKNNSAFNIFFNKHK